MSGPPLDPNPEPRSKTTPAVFVSAAVLLLALGVSGTFLLKRTQPETTAPETSAPETSAPPVDSQSPPPLLIHGIALKDGPKIEPTDLLPFVLARAAGNDPHTDATLLEIIVHGAHQGKVDLENNNASVAYHYLVTRRDPRAEGITSERVELLLRHDAPPVNRSEEKSTAKTVPEPLCVWNAAWRAAMASGLSATERYRVSYGLDGKGKEAVWTFSEETRPESTRTVDGRTCAIKSSKYGTELPTPPAPFTILDQDEEE